MPAQVLLGTEISAQINGGLKARVGRLNAAGVTPGILMIRVGDDPASVSYIKQKDKTAGTLGIRSKVLELPGETLERTLLALIGHANADPEYHGILVQLPLPAHIGYQRIANAVHPSKDVDCFHPQNLGKLLAGEPYLVPCTPHAVQQMLLLGSADGAYRPKGKHVVIVGRSNLVGKPLAAILMQKDASANATVTLCHSGTSNLGRFTRQADILVAAMGAHGAIKSDMVKDGAVVIDVGVTRVGHPAAKNGYRLVGDVDHDSIDGDFARVADKVTAYTPVPGGVGPMTVTMLMWNTVTAAERQTIDRKLQAV